MYDLLPVTAMNTLNSNPIIQSDIDDVNVQSIQTLVTPAELKAELPLKRIWIISNAEG